MASEALFGFAGVILGALTTSVLTVYRERLVTRREALARRDEAEYERALKINTFQRESILALQTAASDAAQLRGRPRPVNDMCVAAVSIANRIPLATRNVKDYEDFATFYGLILRTT